MKKLVVTDFDGTLIDEEEAIPMTTVLAIDQFRNLGNCFAIATEKIPITVLDYNQDFNFLDYVIACNGTYIYDVAKEKVIYKQPLSREIIREVKQNFEDNSLISFATPDQNYLYISTIYQEKHNKIMKSGIKDFNKFLSKHKKHIYKIELFFTNEKEAEESLKKLKKLKLPINATLSEDQNHNDIVEVIMKGNDKSSAVQFLAQLEKIKLKDVVAIGDSLDDLKMIKKVGHGIAVENACQEVKDVANEQTLSNNDKGVEKVLEKLNQLH